MMAALGIGLDKVTLDLILPVGISFIKKHAGKLTK